MRERGLLFTLALVDADQVNAAAAGAADLGWPELAAIIRSLPLWTKATVDDLEAAYLTAADALSKI
jgi:hypothetical protein